MSSLAAARADNFYHPPEYDPSKGSLKKFTGAKGKNQYETDGVIRFELPMDGWCGCCGRHYGKGTRWNAKKEPDGSYFSTKKWKFTFVCKGCPTTFIIATDPKNTDYEFRTGIEKKIEEHSEAQDDVNEGVQIGLDAIYKVGGHAAEVEREDKRSNKMRALEAAQDDQRKVATEEERFDTLVEMGEARRRYDYDANAALRQGMRAKRRAAEKLVDDTNAKQLSIPLLDFDPADGAEAIAALQANQSGPSLALRASEVKLRKRVTSSSVFGKASALHAPGMKQAALVSSVPAIARARASVLSQGDQWPEPTQRSQVNTKIRRKQAKKTKGPANPPASLADENPLAALAVAYDDSD